MGLDKSVKPCYRMSVVGRGPTGIGDRRPAMTDGEREIKIELNAEAMEAELAWDASEAEDDDNEYALAVAEFEPIRTWRGMFKDVAPADPDYPF